MNHNTKLKTTNEIHRMFADRIGRAEMPAYVYSYPPKKAYQRFKDNGRIAESWNEVSGPVNLYVHVPYCGMKCHFCNLFATTRHSIDTVKRYVSALIEELNRVSSLANTRMIEVRSMYFGGGTPTILSQQSIDLLITNFRKKLVVSRDAEIGIEAAPNTVDPARCCGLRSLGFNRISLGIQTFDESELTAMGRHYGAHRGAEAVRVAQEAGFENVNIDLIYGIPGQTERGWRQNLGTAVALGPTTVTLYPLAVRDATVFGKEHRVSPDVFSEKEVLYQWYDIAVEFLRTRGYVQHTLVTFARQDGGCRHEANEFLGVPTIGLGAGARSYTPTLHYTNDDYTHPRGVRESIGDYLKTYEANRGILVRSAADLDREEAIRRHMILNLLYLGVDRADYARRFNESPESRFRHELEVLELEKCLLANGDTLVLSDRGRRFSSLVAELFFSDRVKALVSNSH